MATSKKGRVFAVTVDNVWKGENEDEAEISAELEQSPLATESNLHEAEVDVILKHKLVRLKELYRGQLGRLRYVFREKRRHFLLQWQSEGGQKSQLLDPPTVSSPYDAAISGYGKASGEIGLLQRKRHLKRLKTTVEMLNSGQGNASYSTQRHDQLVHLKHKLVKHHICSKDGCLKTALPLTTYCKQHIAECSDQFLYTKCAFSYVSGKRCDASVPSYVQPPCCPEHAYMLIDGLSSNRYVPPKVVKGSLDPGKNTSRENPCKREVERELPVAQVDSELDKNDPVVPKETESTEELANVISPVSTDSNTCGSKSQDRVYALMCSESEAESTDKEKEI